MTISTTLVIIRQEGEMGLALPPQLARPYGGWRFHALKEAVKVAKEAGTTLKEGIGNFKIVVK